MKQIQFEVSSLLTIGNDEIPVGPERYRAIYEELAEGGAIVEYVEINDARHNQPDNWRRCSMQSDVRREIEKWIETDIRNEQRRMVDDFDLTRRYG